MTSVPFGPSFAGREQYPGAAQFTSSAPITLLGVTFDNVTLTEAVRRIEAMIASRRPHYVVTANVDFLVQARRDVELRRILFDAHLVLCDGTPVVWASRLLGNPLPERVAGADLAPQLIRLAAERNLRLFFLGASEEANARAVANVTAQFPNLSVGHYSPPFQPLLEMDHADIRRRIRAARPDLLFVAFGCPKAEKWIAMHYRTLGVPVAIGVGATIDFLAGRLRRAPPWMRRAGVEWMYRLCQEPRRLVKRYVTDVRDFTGAMLSQWWKLGRHAGVSSAPKRLEPAPQRIMAPEVVNLEAIPTGPAVWKTVATDHRHCVLDLRNLRTMDSTSLATLAQLQKQMRLAGRHLILLSPGIAVHQALVLMGLEGFFEIAGNDAEARALIEARARERSGLVSRGKACPVIWRGEITAANANEVWRRTRAEIQRRKSRGRPCVIDLSTVRFIDSSGVRVMLRAKRYAPRRGCRLWFTRASPAVQNALRHSHLESLVQDGVS